MSDKKRWQERLEDFQKAVSRLEEALAQEEYSELERDGVIQRFEFTFELAWKTLKDYLDDQGFKDVLSPKKAVKQAYANDLLANGDIWVEMLEDRNRMAHLYDQKTSLAIFKNIKDKYAGALYDLAEKLAKDI